MGLILPSGSGLSAWQFTPETYGAKGDGQMVNDGAMTTGSAVFTSASGKFKASDVTKHIMVNGCGPGGGSNPSGALLTTISGYTSPTQVTLAAVNGSGGNVTGAAAVWGTDDTVAIQTAMAALSTYVASAPWYGELIFKPAIYIMAGAAVKGGSTLGNAQIPLPVLDLTDLSVKPIVVIKGTADNSSFAFWVQSAPQVAGACIVSMVETTANDPTWGPLSVIGGPTVVSSFPGAGQFNNISAVIDGITVMCPLNPGQIAFDFWSLCHFAIHTASALVFWAPNGLGHTPSVSNGGGLGLRVPLFGSNDRCDIESLSIEGYNVGMTVDQHVAANRVGIIYSNWGLYVPVPGAATMTHGCWFGYLSIESCVSDAVHVATGAGTSLFGFNVGMLDTEGVGGNDISDPFNALTGTVNLLHNGSGSIQTPVVNGAANLEILSAGNASSTTTVRGSVTAPAVPATTVALTNPFWKHAAVTVTGGTVTVIAVDGTASGLTSGTVIVPSGKTITLTYSVAPSWKWVLL